MEKNPTSLLLRWERNRNFPYPRIVSLISETLILFIFFFNLSTPIQMLLNIIGGGEGRRKIL